MAYWKVDQASLSYFSGSQDVQTRNSEYDICINSDTSTYRIAGPES